MNLPHVPAELAQAFGVDGLSVRAFGSRGSDLYAGVGAESPPAALTEVLVACVTRGDGTQIDRRFFWQLDVGTRLALGLSSAFSAGEAVAVVARCPGCDEELEVELTREELLDAEHRATTTVTFEGRRGPVVLRRPTGADQLRWLETSYPDELAANRAIVASLVVERASDEDLGDLLQRIDEELASCDPLVGGEIEIRCFSCDATSKHPVDVVSRVLARCVTLQRRLVEAVHQLASAYGWTEDQVLALSPRRRAEYLALVERDHR